VRPLFRLFASELCLFIAFFATHDQDWIRGQYTYFFSGFLFREVGYRPNAQPVSRARFLKLRKRRRWPLRCWTLRPKLTYRI